MRENVRTLRKVRHSLQDLVMLKGTTWSREVRAAEREAERDHRPPTSARTVGSTPT